MTTVIAQAGAVGGLAYWLIILIVVAALVGVAYVVAQQLGAPIPPAVVKVFWIVAAAVLGVVAIRFLIGLL